MQSLPRELLDYHAEGGAQVCGLPISPFMCEFWPLTEVERYNIEYEVPELSPGFLAFATSGGGEMLAISPSGTVVSLPFIGMAPSEAMLVAESWSHFVRILKPLG